MAKLYFHYSTMNAGKSTMLLQAAYNYEERGMDTLLLTANLDDRASKGVVGSRIGIDAPAETYNHDTDLYAFMVRHLAELSGEGKEKPACILIDEAQFLSEDQVWQLAKIVDSIGIPVMAYGLRVDFAGELFPGSKTLLAIADELREVRTICWCGSKATMVVRVGENGKAVTGGAQVEIGGNDRYVSLCRKHWCEAMREAKGEPIFPIDPIHGRHRRKG
ncbi:MAG: thymidine kinase [Pseudomonadota bacterium]